MAGLDIEEAKKFIEDEEIDRKRLEELVGKPVSPDAMFTVHFVDNVLDTVRYDICRLEANSTAKEEIYNKLDFYCDLLYVIKDQMCNYKYPKDRQEDVAAGIKKMRELMEKYKKKEDNATKPTMQKPAPAQGTQSASYTQQTFPFKGSAAQGSSSKAPSQPSGNKVWSTKDKNNIDKLLDNFNKRQKKQ